MVKLRILRWGGDPGLLGGSNIITKVSIKGRQESYHQRRCNKEQWWELRPLGKEQILSDV